MTQWLLAPEAADDLDRLADFLMKSAPDLAFEVVDLIVDGLALLVRHPRIGRPMHQGLRELVISHGNTVYVALYSYGEVADVVLVLAVRHQREQDFH